MSEDITNNPGKKRPVLGDLTNRPLKKGFSTILGDSGLKSVYGYNKNENYQEVDTQLSNRACLKVDNMVREKSKTKFGVDNDKNSSSLSKDKQVCQSSRTSSDTVASMGNDASFTLNVPKEIKDKPNMLNEGVQDIVVESRDASRSSTSMITSSGLSKRGGLSAGGHFPGHEGSIASDVAQSSPVHEGLVTLVCKNNEEGLASTKPSSVGWACLPNSQDPKFHELARCTARRDDAGNMNVASDLLKSCSCSFCLKAAYIWSDLHYQDIKGQITALKKSQKEANVSVQKCSSDKETGINSQGNPSRSSNLEMDLMGHWRSLFLHMEDIFQQESNQLQARFVTLKDLRETCKVDLETSNEMPPGKH